MKVLEAHFETYKVQEKPVEVFINPAPDEIDDAARAGGSRYVYEANGVRFTADATNHKVYVFSVDVIHSDITKRMGITDPVDKIYTRGTKLLNGVAKKKNGRWEMTTSDVLSSIMYGNHTGELLDREKEYMKMLLSTNWSWVNRYIHIDTAMDIYKRKWANKEHAEEMYQNEESLGRIKRKLFEAFYKKVPIKMGGMTYGDVTIYVNPSKMEIEKARLESLREKLRFTAFGKDHTMYIFPSNIVHMQAFPESHSDLNPDNPAIAGTIVKRGGSWYFEGSDQLVHVSGMRYDHRFFATVKAILNTDWEWMEKYFMLGPEFTRALNYLEASYESSGPETVKKFLKKKN